jgi:2-oxoglutarate ferredoxin oxidoreductase subunit delta
MEDEDTPKKKSKFQHNLIKELCKGCGFCIEFCPKKVYERSYEINDKGVNLPKVVREEDCIGCNLCSMLCPDLAISVESEEVDKEIE